MKKVYVVYNTIDEEVVSVHETKEAAIKRCRELQAEQGSIPGQYVYEEKELEK